MKKKPERRPVEPPAGVVITDGCGSCSRVFTFDPATVPRNERQRALCQMCVEQRNIDRAALGVPPVTYPASAYP